MQQFFFWVAFLLIIGVAIFAIQNSTASPVLLRFLFWRFETSLIYTILGAIGLGILIALFFWTPWAVRTSIQMKRLKRELEGPDLKQQRPVSAGREEASPKRNG